ncbi:MAG: globin family protein [Phormidesmis sp.]
MSLNVELLEQSFDLVKPEADSLMDSFYNNLFTDYPAAQPLFTHVDMDKQKQQLKGSLVMVIENLRNPEALTKALQGLGARHVKYGALPEHYPLVGNSLLKALSQHAGSAWTPEVKDAWVGAYGAITELMLDGADYTSKDIQLESPPLANTAAEAATTATAPPNTMVSPEMVSPEIVSPEIVSPGMASSGMISPEMIAPPEGLSGKAAAGVIGGGAAALILLLLILL